MVSYFIWMPPAPHLMMANACFVFYFSHPIPSQSDPQTRWRMHRAACHTTLGWGAKLCHSDHNLVCRVSAYAVFKTIYQPGWQLGPGRHAHMMWQLSLRPFKKQLVVYLPIFLKKKKKKSSHVCLFLNIFFKNPHIWVKVRPERGICNAEQNSICWLIF